MTQRHGYSSERIAIGRSAAELRCWGDGMCCVIHDGGVPPNFYSAMHLDWLELKQIRRERRRLLHELMRGFV